MRACTIVVVAAVFGWFLLLYRCTWGVVKARFCITIAYLHCDIFPLSFSLDQSRMIERGARAWDVTLYKRMRAKKYC